MMYLVRTDRGIWRRHQNQLQPSLCDLPSNNRNTNNKRNNPESSLSRPASELRTRMLTMIMKFPLIVPKDVTLSETGELLTFIKLVLPNLSV